MAEQNHQKTTAKPRENRSEYLLTTLFSVIFAAALIIYLGYHFINSFSNDIETEYALYITENDTENFTGYIMRNETVLFSPVEGYPAYLFPDGTKVNIGADIAQIYNDSSTGEQDKLVAIDKKISLLEDSNMIGGLSTSDNTVLDNRIATSYFAIRRAAEKGNFSTVSNRRDELLTLMNKRQIITGTVDNFNTVIDNLKAEKQALMAKQAEAVMTVASPADGYFYSEVDGYESILSSSEISHVTWEEFHKTITESPRTYPGQPIGKLVTDFKWYVACEGAREDLRYFTQGNTYQLIFPYNNDTVITFTLARSVMEQGGDRVLFLFETSSIPEGFSFKREQPVKIVVSSISGYRVPISAVRLVDGKQGVYVLFGSTVQFREFDILLELDGYYIAAPQDFENDPDYKNKLGLYDKIITGGKNLYVGKIIS